MDTKLRELLLQCLKIEGCPPRFEDFNLFQVDIPPNSELNKVLEVTGSAYIALVEYEEDVLAGRDPIRPLLPGSYYLERFLFYLGQSGHVGDVALPRRIERVDWNDIQVVVAQQVPGVRVEFPGEHIDTSRRCIMFHFLIDLLASREWRELKTVTLDAETLQPLADLSFETLPEATSEATVFSDDEIAAAYQQALVEIDPQITAEMEAYTREHEEEKVKAEHQIDEERTKELQAFDRSKRRLRSQRLSKEEIDRRRAALEADWKRRMRQVRQTFLAEGATISLLAVTRQSRPFAVCPVKLRWGDESLVPHDWLLDAYSGKVLLARCQSCFCEVDVLKPGHAPCYHLICEDCSEPLFECDHCSCSACRAKCVECEVDVCHTCTARCCQCEQPVCAEHQRSCKVCRQIVCSDCHVPCPQIHEILEREVSNTLQFQDYQFPLDRLRLIDEDWEYLELNPLSIKVVTGMFVSQGQLPEFWRKKLEELGAEAYYEVLLEQPDMQSDDTMVRALLSLTPSFIQDLPTWVFPTKVVQRISSAVLNGSEETIALGMQLALKNDSMNLPTSILQGLGEVSDEQSKLILTSIETHWKHLDLDTDSVKTVAESFLRQGKLPEFWQKKLEELEAEDYYEVVLGRPAMQSEVSMTTALLDLSSSLIKSLPTWSFPPGVVQGISKAMLDGSEETVGFGMQLALKDRSGELLAAVLGEFDSEKSEHLLLKQLADTATTDIIELEVWNRILIEWPRLIRGKYPYLNNLASLAGKFAPANLVLSFLERVGLTETQRLLFKQLTNAIGKDIQIQTQTWHQILDECSQLANRDCLYLDEVLGMIKRVPNRVILERIDRVRTSNISIETTSSEVSRSLFELLERLNPVKRELLLFYRFAYMAKKGEIELRVWHQILDVWPRLTDENCAYLDELRDVANAYAPRSLNFELETIEEIGSNADPSELASSEAPNVPLTEIFRQLGPMNFELLLEFSVTSTAWQKFITSNQVPCVMIYRVDSHKRPSTNR